MAQKDKIVNSFYLVKFKKEKKETWRGRKKGEMQEVFRSHFLERERLASL